MKTLTITSDNEEALEQVKKLAESLNITFEETISEQSRDIEQNKTTDKSSLVDILEDWHQKGGMKTRIDDPVAWQREQRKDRKLPFRD